MMWVCVGAFGGAGVFRFANGNALDGEFKDDKANGRGGGAGVVEGLGAVTRAETGLVGP